MTRDDIIKLARKAGLATARDETDLAAFVLRFAALVAAAEREACAKTVENLYYGMRFQPTKDECATAIRERGNP